MKIIISTGHGRLHLIDSARALLKEGVTCSLVTGWVPANTPKWFIDLCGHIVGRKKNFYTSMMKRCPEDFPLEQIKVCTISEFIQQGLFLISNKGLISRDKAAVLGWKLYGFSSQSYLNDEKIFHVRSGAGQGGAIRTAKRRGMKVVVDHSIAHPAEVFRQLNQIMPAEDITIKPDLSFWTMILKDCEEADVILVNSDYVKQSFVAEGWNPSNIYVIPLGVREDFLGLKTNYASAGPFRLLFTGNFGSRKGSHLIVQMAEKLRDKGVDFEVDIVGNIEDRSQLPNWFLQATNIHLHGHVLQDDLKNFLVLADAYIFPTYAEGAAQSVKEAMAAGLPVITTFNSGAPIAHGNNGWIVPVHDSNALVDAVQTLSINTSLRKKIGLAACETIKNDHLWSVYANELKGLYHALCAE
jgi:glycosyltransferase involved in cell wall biosynthesis